MNRQDKNYYTVQELLTAALEKAREDPWYQAALSDCVLDYELFSHAVRFDKLTRCEFDVIGTVEYGGSEGIYGSIVFYGNWANGADNGPFVSRLQTYTLKTLSTSKEAYLGMGTLVNMIAYYAMDVMNANLDRFD